jgi:hypothetical protein
MDTINRREVEREDSLFVLDEFSVEGVSSPSNVLK